MYYCETCRILHGWPKGISRSYGRCEACDQPRPCYDVPSSALPPWSKSKRLTLCPIDDNDFHIDQLLGRKEFKVYRTISRSAQRVVIEYGVGEIASPLTDPLIIGTIEKNGEFLVRILWDDKLWRPWDADTDEFLGMMSGVNMNDLKQYFEKRLKK